MHVIVLGIDPGVANTGYGVVAHERGRLVALDGGVIETAAGHDAGVRLAAIHARVGELIDDYQPDAVASRTSTSAPTSRSAFAVGQARGVVLLAAGQRDVRCASYTPQQVKGAVCGTGRAAKDQVQRMVQSLLSLTELPRPDHAADALGVAICHANGAPLRGRAGEVARMIALRQRRGRGPPRRPRRGLLRRRRLPARGLRRDAAPRPARGRPTTLLTHLIVRDDALLLYGFATEEERDLFLLLIGVQSVGPKMALAVLSGGPPRELLGAVAAGDTARLQAVPGIGKRTAERIVVELREKVGAARWPTTRSSSRAPTTRARSPATAWSASASPRRRPTALLDGAPGDTPEDLIAHALKASRR